jgi:hypothetical protein
MLTPRPSETLAEWWTQLISGFERHCPAMIDHKVFALVMGASRRTTRKSLKPSG